MPITEIGEEACSFLCASARAFVVVIGDVADHLQGMLVQWQQPISLHRYGAAGNRVGVEHANDFGPRQMDRARIANPPLLISDSEGRLCCRRHRS